MFGKKELKKQIAELKDRVNTLEKDAHNDYVRNKRTTDSIKEIKEKVGIAKYDSSYPFGFTTITALYSHFVYNRTREAKPFNLIQKVDAILTHLGLEEDISAATKLVKTAKKGKK